MADTMVLNTTNMTSICSNYKSKVSSIDLASVDVTAIFEPFTSVGVLTSYVPSLKDALKSIQDNCTSLISILENLVSTQENIDNGAADGAGSGYFNDYGSGNGNGSGSGSGSHSSGGGQSSGVNNNQQSVGIAPTVDPSLQTLATEPGFMQSLMSIATTSPSTITSEERASYLKELLKIKNQNNGNVTSIIDATDPTVLQAYLQSILNGELPITNVAQSVTFDILQRIAAENNIELTELFKTENLNDIRAKVDELSEEYITLFNSNNLKTDLLAVYDGTVADVKSDDFISSVRTALDIIALNKDTSAESILAEEQYDSYLKEEIGKVAEALSEIRLMGTKSNDEFVAALTTLFGTNTELFTPTGEASS